MKRMMDLKERELRQLSAYLDGELDPKEASRLEMRLKADPQLQKALSELDGTRKLVSSLPQIRPPRNFMLTPEMAGIQRKRSLYPVFRLATVVAAVAFTVLIGTDTFLRFGTGAMRAADQPPQAAEVVVEREVEKVVEEVEEMPLEAAAEPEMEAAQDTLGVEQPRASIAEVTEAFAGEGIEPTMTESVINEVEPTPDGTLMPPGVSLPSTTPTMGEGEAPSEIEPMVPSLQPTSIPSLTPEPDETRFTIEPIRAAEIGLGVLAVILGAVTIILRRQR